MKGKKITQEQIHELFDQFELSLAQATGLILDPSPAATELRYAVFANFVQKVCDDVNADLSQQSNGGQVEGICSITRIEYDMMNAPLELGLRGHLAEGYRIKISSSLMVQSEEAVLNSNDDFELIPWVE